MSQTPKQNQATPLDEPQPPETDSTSSLRTRRREPPAPFADMVESEEERSLFPLPNPYPSFADAIQVTVHTVYRSTEAP